MALRFLHRQPMPATDVRRGKTSMPPLLPLTFADARSRRSAGIWARRAATALVLTGLVGVACWGHRSDWRFLSTHSRDGVLPTADRTMWVEAGPASTKVATCPDHGLPICPTCHPEVAQLAKRPTPAVADRERVRRALAVRDRPAGDSTALRLPRAIRFASAEAVDGAGIDITPVWTGPATEAVAGSGELSFDPARYARLAARAAGTAWRVFKRVGDPVKVGDVLALVDAAEVGKAKAELQVALVQVRLRAQAAKDLAAAPVQERQRKEAEAALREAEFRLLGAEQALVNLGFELRAAELRALSAADVADRLQRLGLPVDLPHGEDGIPPPGTLLPVRAPRDGLVLKAEVVAGEAVDPTKVLFAIADPIQLRLTVHVAPDEAGWVKVGQPVRFRPDGGTAEAVGRVTRVGVAADEVSRTVPVWAEVPNPDGRLRASTLGTGRVVLREEPDAAIVPAVAIHAVGGVPVVFVRDRDFLSPEGSKAFHVRPVLVGARTGTDAEIIAGLWVGEVVATKGSAVLADELRKSLSVGK